MSLSFLPRKANDNPTGDQKDHTYHMVYLKLLAINVVIEDSSPNRAAEPNGSSNSHIDISQVGIVHSQEDCCLADEIEHALKYENYHMFSLEPSIDDKVLRVPKPITLSPLLK